MKKFLLVSSFVFSGIAGYAQCAYDNTLTGGTVNLACPASTTAVMQAGQYIVVNVTAGITYTFQTCGGSGCDTQLSLYTAGGGTNLAYNDDNCGLQSVITWTATYTGQANLLLDQYFCTNSGAACPATVSISCSGPPTAPPNDNPCGSVPLPVGPCSNTPVTINGATTATTGVPAPGCGGYNGGDVWYSVVVPANGQVTLTSTAGTITDAAMAAYSAPSCSGPFTLLGCNDNANGAMPGLNLSALTPGSTIYIRVWDFNNDNFGGFTICAIPGCNSGGGNTACTTADPFCTGTTYNYCNTTNVPSLGGGGIYGCLGSSPNPAFYYLNISTSGNIDIFMSQTSTTGVPIDVDFICWGPFASQAAMCAGIGAGNIVDCSYSGAATETVNITGAVAGQWYMLLITNFSNQPGSVAFSQTGGTGTTNCNIVAPCTVTAVSTPVSCNGGTNGTITATVTGTPNYTVSVVNSGGTTVGTQTGAGTTYTFTGLPAGTYTVNLGAAGPCTNTTTVTITQPVALSATSNHTNLLCATPCSGTLTASGAGGTAPYTYNWNGGLGAGANKTGVCAGTYIVTVTDANGCTTTSTQTITAPPAIVVTPTATPTLCAGQCNGTLNATATGGTGAYTFSWSGGLGAGAAKTGVCAGTYTVTVTDANGCTAIGTVTVVPGPTIVPSFTYNGNQCLTGNSFNFTNTSTVAGGTGATTYAWNFGAGATPATSTTQNPTGVVYSTTGSHTVTLTVTNNGCSQTVTVNVITHPMPAVTIAATNVLCNGACNGTLTATGSLGTTPYNFTWSGGLGTGANKTGVCPGTYTVTITDANGCTSTATATITQPPLLTVSATGTNVTCNGTCNGTLNATSAGGTGAVTFNWSSGLGAGAAKTGVCPGTYTVTATDANGCTATSTFTITQPPLLTVSATGTNLTCNGVCNGTLNATSAGGTGAVTFNWSGGLGAGAAKAGVCAGTYTVTATDANGCTATATFTITQPPLLTVTAVGTNVTCNGLCNGTLNASSTGGTGAVTYNWSGGLGAGAAKTGVCAGTYTVTATDANGCTATSTFTITQPAALTVTATGTNATCNGICNGTLNAVAAGGTAGYTYNWGALGAGASITGVCAGTYTVTVTDANGCIITANVTITQPTPIVLTTSSTNTNCGGSTGTATVNASGGAGGYTYSWAPGLQTTATATALAAGSYTVTVTDANGCTATATQAVNNNTAPTATEIGGAHVNVLCNGGNNGAAAITIAGGTPGYTIVWAPAPGGGQGTTNVTGLSAGTYTATVTDANGCTVVATITITQPTALISSAVVNNHVSCNGGNNGSATVTASGGVGGNTFVWAPAPGGGQGTATATGLSAGTYTVTVTNTNGCTSISNVTITQPAALTAAIVPTHVLCNGGATGSANLTVTGGTGAYTYNWTGPGAFGSVVQDPTNMPAGNYTVTVTDANGCTVTANTTITQPPALTVSTIPVDAHCGLADGSASATSAGGTGAVSFIWYSNAGLTTQIGTGATINALVAGTYYVLATDANGCTVNTSVTISNLAGVTAVASVISNATGAGLCNGSATVTPSGGVAPYTYAWTNGATTQTTNTLCAGNMCVTVTDASGCTATSCVTITEPGPLTVTLTGINLLCNAICNGSATSNASGGVTPYTYLWSNAATTANINALCAGTYSLTVTDANGNTANASVIITQPLVITLPAPGVTNVNCNGACDGIVNALASGGTGALNYNWSGGLGAGSAHSNACAGNYTVTVTDANGCTANATVTVTEPAPIALTFTTVPANCNQSNGSATVTATGGTPPYSYSWSAGSTTATQNAIPAGTYTVTVTDSKGCIITGTATVGNNPPGLLTAVVNNQVSCFGASNGQATANLAGGAAPVTYSWNTAPVQNNAVATGLAPGTWTVSATDANGCVVTAMVTITQPTQLTVTASATAVSCPGGTDGTVSSTTTGGTPVYTFNWTGGATTANVTGLAAGTYTITSTDANGCTANASVTVTQPVPLIVNTTVVNVNCFNICNGGSNATVTGGTAPYSFVWNDPLTQITAAAGNLCAGAYTVTVTDNNGCTTTGNINITQPTQLTVTPTTVSSHCGQPDGQACVNVTGGVAPYSYAWSNGGTTACLNNIPGANYTVIVTDANGCTQTLGVPVADIGGPTAVIIAQTPVSCFGGNNGSATVNMVGGTGIFTVLWDIAAGSQTTPTASNLTAGTYGVTVTDAAGCSASTSVIITEPTDIIYIQNQDNPTCFNYCDGIAWVGVSGGTTPYNFAWTDGTGTGVGGNNDSITNLCQGVYNLVMTDANGCTETMSYTLIEPAQLAGTLTSQHVTCNAACNGQATVNMNVGASPFTYAWSASAGNQTTQTATSLCAGAHAVLITDVNGCFMTMNTTITEPPVLDVVISAFGDVSCSGFCDGFAQATATGGTGPYTFLWSNGVAALTNNNICTGTYTITVTDVNGCTDQATVTISTPNPLVVNVTGVDLTCFNQCIGSVNSVINGGTTPYAIQWDDPNFNTTNGVNNLCAGTYTVVVNDANGCNVTQSITLTQPPMLDFAVAPQDAFCQQPNGQICISPIGGVAPLAIQWNDPMAQTSACAFNLLAGCYLATVTDANGCVKDSLVCINDIAGPTVALVSVTDVTCAGANDGSIVWDPQGGTGTLTLEWLNGLGNPIPALNGQTSSTTLNGDTYGFVVTDSAGCVATLTQFVNEPNSLVAAVTASTPALCFGSCDGTATVSSSGGNGGNTILWTSGTNATAANNTGLCVGTHSVTVTDVNGCNATASVTITQPTPLVVGIANFTNVTCNGFCDGQIAVDASGATLPYSFAWTNNVSTGANAVALCPNNYNITVTDANGCFANVTQAITEPTALVVTTTGTDETCSQCNGTTQATVNGGTLPYLYQWAGGNTPTQPNNTALCNGTHTVTVTDDQGCVATSSVTINDQAGPVINGMVFTQPLCSGQSNGTTTVNFTGGTGVINFSWNDPASQTTQTATGLPIGTYCVSLVDVNGCQAAQCVTVTQPNPLGAVADLDVTICYGDSTQVWGSGTGGTIPYTVNWQAPGLVGAGPIMVYPTSTTTYCLTVTDANGCLSPVDCATVTVNPPLDVDVIVQPGTICDGETAVLSASATGGNGGPFTFTWVDDNNNNIPSTTAGAISNANISPSVTTWYYVTLDDACSIPATDSVMLTVNPLPQGFVNVADADGCAAHTAQFVLNTDIGTAFGYDFTCDGIIDVTSGSTTANYTYTQPGTYDVCVTFISAAGCTSVVSQPAMITVYALPVAGFITDPDSVTSIFTPDFNFTEIALGEVSYAWSFGDGNTSNMANPTHTYADTGWYQVSQIVTSSDGCLDTAYHMVYVQAEFAMYVPNAFTPDGDGVNDVFLPMGIDWDMMNYDLMIFNRWGEVIFNTQDAAKGWDGTENGIKSKTDVYVWKLKVRDSKSVDREFVGHVTLLR